MKAIVVPPTITTEVPMDESSLVATATPAEVQMKVTVGPTTTAEVPMDESSLVATPVEVQMQLILTTATTTTTEVPTNHRLWQQQRRCKRKRL